MSRSLNSRVLLVSASLLASFTAFAQTESDYSGPIAELEEIVVTAERRSEDLQKAALSITALTADDLAAQSRDNIRDILQVVPGVVVQESTFGSTVSMRGIATTAAGSDSATTTYVDGIPVLGNPNIFYGLSRVEVLRGPQGTLYGKNSSGGVVNVVTADPTQIDEAMGAVDVGNYAMLQTTGMVNVPLSDSLAVRATFTSRDRDGFLSNGQNDQDDKNLRVKLAYRPSDGFDALLAGTVSKDDAVNGGQVTYTLGTEPSFDTTNSNGYSHTNYYSVYGHLNWNFDFGSFTVLPSYQHEQNEFSKYVNSNLNEGSSPTSAESSTLEIRLSSNDTGSVKWVAGLYGNHESTLISQYLDFVSFYGVYNDNTKSDSLGVYGQATWSLTDYLRLTGGARYTQDTRDAIQDIYSSESASWEAYNYNQTFTRTDYKARVELDVAQNSLVYAGVTTGYRAGGYATQGASFDAEDLTAYSVGSKNRFFGDRVELNAEAYYYDYGGFQITDPIWEGTSIVGFNVLSLPATFQGVDLESKFLITRGDQLNVSVSYEKGEFDKQGLISTVLSDGSTALESFGGTQTPFTPQWTIMGGYSHTFELGSGATWTAGVNGTYRDDQYLANIQQPLSVQDAYTLWDANLNYTSSNGKFSINAYGKNLSDEIYRISAQVNSLTATSSNVILGNPRTYGISLMIRM